MATELRIGYLSTLYHTSLILMGTRWLEDRFGIKPDWRLFGGGPPIVNALANNELDIGYVGLPPVIIGIDRGAPIKCIAGGHREGTVLIAKPKAKSFDELGDLGAAFSQFAGEVIGVPPVGSIHDIIIRHQIQEYGLTEHIEVRNFKWADLILAAMENGTLKAAAGTPALATAAEGLGANVIIPADRLWPNNPSCGIAVRAEIINESPQLLNPFLKAHRQAIKFIKVFPNEAAEIIVKVVGFVDKEFVLKTLALSPKYDTDLTPEFIAGAMAFVPVLRHLGYISGRFEENDIFDLRFFI